MRFIGLTSSQLEGVLARFNRRHGTSIHLTEHGSWGVPPKSGGVRRPWVQGQLKLTSCEHPYHRRKLPMMDFATQEYKRVPGRMPFVCWHGVRDLFRAVFAKYPLATIRAGRAVYKGAEHFEATFEQTDCNIGSQISPLYFSQACDCKENGQNWTGLAAKIEHNRKLRRLMGKQVA